MTEGYRSVHAVTPWWSARWSACAHPRGNGEVRDGDEVEASNQQEDEGGRAPVEAPVDGAVPEEAHPVANGEVRGGRCAAVAGEAIAEEKDAYEADVAIALSRRMRARAAVSPVGGTPAVIRARSLAHVPMLVLDPGRMSSGKSRSLMDLRRRPIRARGIAPSPRQHDDQRAPAGERAMRRRTRGRGSRRPRSRRRARRAGTGPTPAPRADAPRRAPEPPAVSLR